MIHICITGAAGKRKQRYAYGRHIDRQLLFHFASLALFHLEIVKLVGGKDFCCIRRRRPVPLAVVLASLLLLALLALCLLLALVADVACVPERAQGQEGHEDDAEDGAADEDPAQGLNVGPRVAVELDADLVVYLLNL